jgi:hypothetical protein
MRTRTYGIDSDTIAYANRIKTGAGVTLAPEALKQINKFVVGIKRMGLWSSMVCWPMRSIHNAGTGSTVYSLGGLGVYNGTMVNSPSWGNIGVLFTGSSYFSYSITNSQPQTVLASVKSNNPSSTGINYYGRFTNGPVVYQLNSRYSIYSGVVFNSNLIIDASYHFLGTISNGTNSSIILDGSSESGNIGSESSSSNSCMGGAFSFVANHYIGFAIRSNQIYSLSSIQNIRTIYMKTIGQNLGLV